MFPDSFVIAEEHAQEIGSSNDADKFVVAVDDGQAPHVLERGDSGGVRDGCIGPSRNDGRCHQVVRGFRLRFAMGARRFYGICRQVLCRPPYAGHFGQQIRLRHDAEDTPIGIDDRQSAHMRTRQRFDDLFER